jgi:dihydropyrimidinase
MVMVHAEEDDIIKHMEAKLLREGRAHLANFPKVHTDLGDELEFNKVCRLGAAAGAAVYLVHVPGAGGASVIRAARARHQPVYGEVLHNMLCFSSDVYSTPDGPKYHIGVGLRTDEDRDALWRGLQDGTLSTLATDEYTTSLAIKMAGVDIESTPGGHAGIETRGVIGFSEGWRKGRIGLKRFVEVFATNPARLMGLYPQKGTISVGSDADLVVWNPAVEKTITMDDLHHDSDYSPWEGWQVTGWPELTILRGKVMVRNGVLLGETSDGQWLSRVIAPEVLTSPAV